MDQLLDSAIKKMETEKRNRQMAEIGTLATVSAGLIAGFALAPVTTGIAVASLIGFKSTLEEKIPSFKKGLDQLNQYVGQQNDYTVRLGALKFHKANWRPIERDDYRSQAGFDAATKKIADTAARDRQLVKQMRDNKFRALYDRTEYVRELPSYLKPKPRMRFE